MSYQIAIDGPAGAGKSTIAKKLAAKLGFVYVDTGAMYRAMALACLRKGIAAEDESAVAETVEGLHVLIAYENGVQQVFVDGENVSSQIRTAEVGDMTSRISVYLPVREKMVALQQSLAEVQNVIMDGRDIGTCVLPNADVKIYMTASVRVRAERRYKEYQEKGISCTLESVEKDVEERDYRDMHRSISPLRQADDAVLLDTSEMNIDEVVEAMAAIALEKGIVV